MRQLTLSDGRVITTNSEQDEALTMLEEWSRSTDLFALLSGYAGTGKTTLTKEFIRFLNSESMYAPAIAVTAPTHKAKRVISDATDLEGFTIQKGLGLGLDADVANFDPNKPEFKPKYKPLLPDYKYVVVDEGSMLNKKLLDHLFTMATNSRTKILFMADKAQLPPVNELVSEIFTSPLITHKYQLTKVERQQGDNPLMAVYDDIRSNLRSSSDVFKRTTNISDKEEGIEFLKEAEFETGVLNAFTSDKFNIDPEHAKLLCWTNDEVTSWNKMIRKHRMATINPGVPIGAIGPGDLMMAYASRENYITNASEYVVESAVLGSVQIEYPNPKNPAENFITDLPCIIAKSVDVDTGMPVELRIVNPRDKKVIAQWLDIYYAYIGAAKKNTKKWADYFKNFRGKVLLMENIVRGTSDIKKDIDFGYAITVHKSQGSTYDQVFIVETDINKNRRNTERNQLKYVSLSRPRHRASLLI